MLVYQQQVDKIQMSEQVLIPKFSKKNLETLQSLYLDYKMQINIMTYIVYVRGIFTPIILLYTIIQPSTPIFISSIIIEFLHLKTAYKIRSKLTQFILIPTLLKYSVLLLMISLIRTYMGFSCGWIDIGGCLTQLGLFIRMNLSAKKCEQAIEYLNNGKFYHLPQIKGIQ